MGVEWPGSWPYEDLVYLALPCLALTLLSWTLLDKARDQTSQTRPTSWTKSCLVQCSAYT
jgi:hypothetical protein